MDQKMTGMTWSRFAAEIAVDLSGFYCIDQLVADMVRHPATADEDRLVGRPDRAGRNLSPAQCRAEPAVSSCYADLHCSFPWNTMTHAIPDLPLSPHF